MYHQDWLIRQIEMMTRFLASLLLGKETDSGIHLTEERPASGDAGALEPRLAALTRSGRFCEAEDLLFDAAEAGDPEAAAAGLRFYRELNALDDDALTRGRFSRPEILRGLEDLCAVCGWDLAALGWEEPAPADGEEDPTC